MIEFLGFLLLMAIVASPFIAAAVVLVLLWLTVF